MPGRGGPAGVCSAGGVSCPTVMVDTKEMHSRADRNLVEIAFILKILLKYGVEFSNSNQIA